MTTNFNDIAVTIEEHVDGRHVALINGEIIAKLSPHRRPGYGGRPTSWRVMNASNRVEVNGLSSFTEKQNIETLISAARRLWYNRQPDVIETKAREAREGALARARDAVRHYERVLAEAKAELAKLEGGA